MIKNLVFFIRNQLEKFKSLFYLLNNKFEYVFFSESQHYQKFYLSFINELIGNKKKLIYLSSSYNDNINHKNIKNLYIGSGFIRNLVFQIIRSDYLFLTTTDLGYNQLKKTNNVKNYTYIFHAANSVHRAYTKTAFDNYDEVFCIGNYQIKELERIENTRNLKKKKLSKVGYFFFDNLPEVKNIDNNKILIAPSWNYSKTNFVSEYLLKLIDAILENTRYEVIFRPHPEHLKSSKNTLNEILMKFSKNARFKFDNDKDNYNSILESKCLITDNSGIGIEYILGIGKPVLYFDKYLKIHNEEFDLIQIEPFEDKVKNLFGYCVKNPDFKKIENYINHADSALKSNHSKKEEFIKNNFFNFKKANKYAFNHICSLSEF